LVLTNAGHIAVRSAICKPEHVIFSKPWKQISERGFNILAEMCAGSIYAAARAAANWHQTGLHFGYLTRWLRLARNRLSGLADSQNPLRGRLSR